MAFNVESLVISLIIGAVAGWLAGQIMRGAGFGLIGNIIVGMVGAVVAGLLLPGFWPITGIVGAIMHSAIGAIIVLFVITARRDGSQATIVTACVSRHERQSTEGIGDDRPNVHLLR